MKKIVFLFLAAFSVFAMAQPDEISVLFLGNSLTNGNSTNETDPTTGPSIAHHFIEMAESAGFDVHVEMYAPNGVYVYDDPYNSDNPGHVSRTTTENLINSRIWDYVYVQDNSGAYMWAEGYISSDVANANIELCNKIKNNNPTTREIFYAAPGFRDGLPSEYWHSGGLDLDYDDNIQATIREYKNAVYLNANGMHEMVAPAGLAWNRYCLDGHSKYDLYADIGHPTLKGTYLSAAVVFFTIFKVRPENVTYDGGFSDANYLLQIAYETVMEDSVFTATRISVFTPQVTLNGNVLQTPDDYDTYQWYENATAITGAISNEYEIDHVSYYSVQVTDASGCSLFAKSAEYGPAITASEEYGANVEIYPVPVKEYLTVKSEGRGSIEVYDVAGNKVYEKDITEKTENINTSKWKSGVYFIRIKDKNRFLTKKVVKM